MIISINSKDIKQYDIKSALLLGLMNTFDYNEISLKDLKDKIDLTEKAVLKSIKKINESNTNFKLTFNEKTKTVILSYIEQDNKEQNCIIKKEETKKDKIKKNKTEKDKTKKEDYEIVIEYFNELTRKKYRPKTYKDIINARLKDDYTLKDFFIVINNKYIEWNGNAVMEKYLTPPTLFAKSHFDTYLNSIPILGYPSNIQHLMLKYLTLYDKEELNKIETEKDKTKDDEANIENIFDY